MNDVYLGLGSNLKQPRQQIRQAIKHLSQLSNTQYIGCAPLYESKPWGVSEQPNFVNTVIKISTSLTPLALLKAIKVIEYRLMQRPLNARWHARTIDIDILLFGQRRMQRPTLSIPHPLMLERSFVLVPLMHFHPQLPKRLTQQIQQQITRLNSHAELTPLGRCV